MDDDNDNNDDNNNDTHPPRIIVRVGMVFRRGQKIFDPKFWLFHSTWENDHAYRKWEHLFLLNNLIFNKNNYGAIIVTS